MPAPSTHPDPDPLLDPLLTAVRAKPVRKQSGQHSVVMAPKPAIEAREPETLRLERMVAIAFGTVLDALGISNVTVAEAWGVSENVVRGVRSRQRPLTYVKFRALPKDVRDALDAEAERLIRLADSLPTVPESLRTCRPENDHHVIRR